MIGKRLAHYRLLELIGSGGMGDVYRARDEQLHRDVAVKVLRDGMLADQEGRARLRREAVLLSQVNHPNVATIHYFGIQDDVAFLAMEHVEGTSLETLLAGQPLPESEVRRLGIQLMQGLKAAHAHGVVHRDLKPRNLRITPDGLLKILDFGLARQWESHADLLSTLGPDGTATTLGAPSGSSAIEGTVPYMPPEQLRSGMVDARSDIYSAGMVLYEMSVGKRPFAALAGPQLVAAILSDIPVPPHELSPGVSANLSAIIVKALDKDPERRFRQAGEMLNAIERPETSQPQQIVGAAAADTRPRMRRVRWVVAAGILAALAVFVGTPFGRRFRDEVWNFVGGPVKPGEIQALAVLPFDDLSGETDNRYFSDGMTDELITRLSQIGAIQVIARHSVMGYRDHIVPIAQIAKDLNVDAVLEGSVLHAQDRVRVAVRLIVAATGRTLWADSYERDVRNVLSLQDELARAITERIRAVVTPEEKVRLASSRPIDPRAFESYLQGRFLSDRENYDDQNKAIEHFQSAIKIEPTYALAYAGMAQVYYQASTIFLPPEEAMPKARAAAERALEIDPNLAEAHTILALVQSCYDWDWSKADAGFRRAVRLGPGSAAAHMFYSYYLTIRGRFDAAIQEITIARRLDPLSRYMSSASLFPLYEGRRFDEAIAAARQILAAEPTQWHAAMILGQSLIQKHQYGEAISVLQRASDTEHGQTQYYCLAYLGVAQAAAGNTARARTILEQMRALQTKGEHAYLEAVVHIHLGEFERAFEFLEKSIDLRSEEALMLGNDADLDPLRSDPRFARLQQRMGL